MAGYTHLPLIRSSKIRLTTGIGVLEELEHLASAYTPGLTVSGDIVVRRVRRLPIKGEVLVNVGDLVNPEQVVAQAMLPGALQTVKVTEKLGIEPQDVPSFLKVKLGDAIQKDQLIAEGKKLFGLFKAPTATSEHAGVLESISEVTGNLLIREPSIPVDIKAYVKGSIAETLPSEGVIVETRCAMIQGIFGVGGERVGTIRVAVPNAAAALTADSVLDSDRGKILVGGSIIAYEAITRAASVGAIGLIAGGVKDSDLIKFLGFDIGVAITGQEPITLTMLVTEGFGNLNMAERTFNLLKSLDGQEASINGATQIRAGVIRPEILVPLSTTAKQVSVAADAFELKAGTAIRVIREPYFGRLGTVTDLPAQLVVLESGTEVRVLRAKLSDGEEVTVPRANVEIMASS